MIKDTNKRVSITIDKNIYSESMRKLKKNNKTFSRAIEILCEEVILTERAFANYENNKENKGE